MELASSGLYFAPPSAKPEDLRATSTTQLPRFRRVKLMDRIDTRARRLRFPATTKPAQIPLLPLRAPPILRQPQRRPPSLAEPPHHRWIASLVSAVRG